MTPEFVADLLAIGFELREDGCYHWTFTHPRSHYRVYERIWSNHRNEICSFRRVFALTSAT